jgi:hypothetical protein
MELFQQLGHEVERLWCEANYDEAKLPSIAKDALKSADLPSKLTAWDVLEWTLKQNTLPPQKDVRGNFGDPPITLFVGPRFHIDVYFWFDGTTAIHQHSFSGAFQVLLGSSIHSWYEFERDEVINTFAETGKMSLKVCELLEVGDTQEIWGGRQYIHSLFHLDQPSATIVVRTTSSPLDLPQYSYHKPGLAADPFFERDDITKKVQTISALIRVSRPDTDEQIANLLEASDLHTSFLYLSHLRGFLRSNHIAQLFKLEEPKARFDKFLNLVIDKHGKTAEILRPVFAHIDMQDEIVNRRAYVTQPEHRFFIALLMNIDSRAGVFKLIKDRYSDAEPVEKVLDWVFDLAQTRVVGSAATATTNALGLPDFGDAEMSALEGLLNNKSDDEIAAAFAAENPNASADTIKTALEKIRSAVIFRPLLA